MTRGERLLIIFFGVILISISTLIIYFFLLPLSDLHQGLETNINNEIAGIIFYGIQIIVVVNLIFWGLFFSNLSRKYTKIAWIVGGIFGFLMIPGFYYFVVNNVYSLLESF